MRLFILLLLLIYSKSIFALSIDDSVKSTIANNLKVKIAFEKLNESKETIEVAIGKKLPTVTGTISGTYSNSDTTSAAGVSTTPEKLLQISIKLVLLKICTMVVKKI